MKTALSILILCGCIGSIMGLQCYFCSQDASNPGCGEPFNPSSARVMTCPGNDSMCVTTTIKGSYTRVCGNAGMCTQNGCVGDICLSCCNEDLCNGKSIEEGVKDVLHCYTCLYGGKDNSTTTDGTTTGPCGDPFDKNGEGVLSLPCPKGSQCGVARVSVPGEEEPLITRTCFNDQYGQSCKPGCTGSTCMSCCSDNLCNNGPVPVPDHANSPVVAGFVLAASLLAAACMQ